MVCLGPRVQNDVFTIPRTWEKERAAKPASKRGCLGRGRWESDSLPASSIALSWGCSISRVGGGRKLKGLSTEHLIAGDGRADMPFDVLDHTLRAFVVADEWPAGWVVHAVRHVSHENHMLAVAGKLTKAEGTSQHTHVDVHAGENHVLNAPCGEDIPNFLTSVGDVVACCVNLDCLQLSFPGHVGIMVDDDHLLNATARQMKVVIEPLEKVKDAYTSITSIKSL